MPARPAHPATMAASMPPSPHSADLSPAPSPWVWRWTPLVPAGSAVLDLACGRGRHVRWFAQRGHPVTGVDRDPDAIAAVRALGGRIEAIEADLENGPWPLAGRRFGAVVVTNYLWRPLLPSVLASVADGGVLIYETFAVGNETVGRPARPDFLLRTGELLQLCDGPAWHIVAYEDGFLNAPERFVQRIAAVRRDDPQAAGAERYPL